MKIFLRDFPEKYKCVQEIGVVEGKFREIKRRNLEKYEEIQRKFEISLREIGETCKICSREI